MAKKAEYLKDRYRSIRNKYPKVNEDSLPEDITEKIDYATKVVANPTLAGTESEMTGIQVGDTKYKMPEGIPTITLDASQMISEYTAQLTDAQFNILNNNTFVTVILPNNTVLGFTKSFRSGTQYIDFQNVYNLDQTGGANVVYINEASISISDKIITLKTEIIYSSKQLYQHNIPLYRDNSTNGVVLGVVIITDTNVKFTMSTLHQWLTNNKFDFYRSVPYRNVNGVVGVSGSSKIATGIGYNSMQNPEKIAISYLNTSGVGETVVFYNISDITINDDDNHYIIQTI